MMTEQELAAILDLRDLAGALSLIGCGQLTNLQCYACDPKLQQAVRHLESIYTASERAAIFKAVCGCAVSPPTPPPGPAPAPQSTPPQPPPAPPPVTPVVTEEECPQTIPPQGKFTGTTAV